MCRFWLTMQGLYAASLDRLVLAAMSHQSPVEEPRTQLRDAAALPTWGDRPTRTGLFLPRSRAGVAATLVEG